MRAPSAIGHLGRGGHTRRGRLGLHRPITFAGASRRFHGGYHSSGHFSSLSFALGFGSHFGTWGLYAYPYHYSYYLPYSYYRGRSSFAVYWSSHYPLYYGPWWWPSYSYAPGRWSGYYSDYYDDSPTYYYPGYRSTVIYGVIPDSSSKTAEDEEDSEDARIDRLTQEHLDLGDFYFKQGRFKEAAESYMRALAYAPDDGSIHFVIADALFAQGDYHYAAFMISKGLELDPDLALAEANKRSFYEDPKLFDREMETLRSYIEDKPFDAAAHLVLGYNLRFSGDRSAAKAPLERALEIDPGNRAAKALLDAYHGEVKPAPSPAGKGLEPVKEGR